MVFPAWRQVWVQDLQCPISLDLMTSPAVLLQTGQIYDAAQFATWLKEGDVQLITPDCNLPFIWNSSSESVWSMCSKPARRHEVPLPVSHLEFRCTIEMNGNLWFMNSTMLLPGTLKFQLAESSQYVCYGSPRPLESELQILLCFSSLINKYSSSFCPSQPAISAGSFIAQYQQSFWFWLVP